MAFAVPLTNSLEFKAMKDPTKTPKGVIREKKIIYFRDYLHCIFAFTNDIPIVKASHHL